MKANRIANTTPPSRAMRIVAILLACIWLVLGVVELITPARFTSMYGLEVEGEAGFTYVRGIGARNIVLAWSVIFAAICGYRAQLAALSAGLCVMSIIEFLIACFAVGFLGAIRFLIFALVLAALAVWISVKRKDNAK